MARDDCNPHSHPLDSGSMRLLYIAMHADVCVRTLQCDGAIMAPKQAKHIKQQSRSLAETSLLKYETLPHRHLIYSRAPMIGGAGTTTPPEMGDVNGAPTPTVLSLPSR